MNLYLHVDQFSWQDRTGKFYNRARHIVQNHQYNSSDATNQPIIVLSSGRYSCLFQQELNISIHFPFLCSPFLLFFPGFAKIVSAIQGNYTLTQNIVYTVHFSFILPKCNFKFPQRFHQSIISCVFFLGRHRFCFILTQVNIIVETLFKQLIVM